MSHSPAVVVLSVIGGLFIVTFGLIVFLRLSSGRGSRRHIETADFDFHPHLPDHPENSTNSVSVFFTSVIERFKRLRGGNTTRNIVLVRENSSQQKKLQDYGSFGASLDSTCSS